MHAVQGEMGATAFFYPLQWISVGRLVEGRLLGAAPEGWSPSQLKVGLGLNNNKARSAARTCGTPTLASWKNSEPELAISCWLLPSLAVMLGIETTFVPGAMLCRPAAAWESGSLTRESTWLRFQDYSSLLRQASSKRSRSSF